MTHNYNVVVTWTGNQGSGTSGYRDYSRAHDVVADGPAPIAGSSDPSYRGESSRWNPEQLLVASLAQCHMLWYLHLCSDAGVVVHQYRDQAFGAMAVSKEGGKFTEVVLRPHVTVATAEMADTAISLHERANKACFIANSVNFPVSHEPTITVSEIEHA